MTAYRDRGDAFAIGYPAGWHRAPATLTPHLVNPREIVTIGTGPLPAGGRCAQFPTRALQALGPGDALVTVQERIGGPTGGAKPSSFAPTDGFVPGIATRACAPASRFAARIVNFDDHGRTFDALLAYGPTASARVRAQALAILDSFRATVRP